MDKKWYGVIDIAFVFAPVLAFAFWELYSLRRDKRRRAEKPPPENETPPE